MMSLKNQHDAIVEENIWDDSLLTKAYIESICYANEELAERLACSTNKSKIQLGCNPSRSLPNFKRGDYVRATYKDGMDYEAKIISLSDNGICLVKFIGYNNVQESHITDLVCSWGKSARRIQYSEAKLNSQTGYEKSNTEENNFNRRHNSFLCPPKPPLPFIARYENCENLSAMLMAWYMSGYYTGLYECQQEREVIFDSNK